MSLQQVLPFLLGVGLLGSCVQEPGGESPDGKFESAFQGQRPNLQYTDCKQKDIVDYLNSGVDFAKLVEDGVHVLAALNIIETRSGADGELGTEDDVFFESVIEVDAVEYVGPAAMEQLGLAAPRICGVSIPAAYEVNRQWISVEDLPPADFYTFPNTETYSMNGIEHWQQWPNGLLPSYEFDEGTDAARRCMQASALRFIAIMDNPPEDLGKLLQLSSWEGGFNNRVDDFSMAEEKIQNQSGVWAWRSGQVKWMSQVNQNGGCYLPTWDTVAQFSRDCLAQVEVSGGDIEGCEASLLGNDNPL